MPRPPTWLISILVLALVALPYLVAASLGGAQHTFTGALLNTQDAASYLAKMRQGWEGSWLFQLPFTAAPGPGTPLFVFYLALGHLARLTGLSLPLTFHLARLAAAVALLYALHRFLAAALPASPLRPWTFTLAALGSGMGWLALPAGAFTADFWVVETYPFLSAYSTPHFALGLALLLWLLTPHQAEFWARRWFWPHPRGWGPDRTAVALASLALGLVAPFGVVVALAVLGGLALWEAWPLLKQSRPAFARCLWRLAWQRPAWVLLGGAPPLLMYLYFVQTHPALAGWNAQNLTASPPPWDLALSLSPALLLALPGAWAVWKGGEGEPNRAPRLLLAWAVLGLLLVYLPLGLQRRFLMGLYVPLVALAALGLERLASASPRRLFLLGALALLLALPTNLVVLLTGLHGANSRDPAIYLSAAEVAALDWLALNAPPGSLVLASPEMGQFIPGRTGLRVIYGHPFETVEAEARKSDVSAFFAGEVDRPAFLASYRVDYVFYGPREAALGALPGDHGRAELRPAFTRAGVSVWEVVQP